jgi:hypothetical protein
MFALHVFGKSQKTYAKETYEAKKAKIGSKTLFLVPVAYKGIIKICTIKYFKWPRLASEALHCAACKKDLLFALLWGSVITPPKTIFLTNECLKKRHFSIPRTLP